MRKAKCNVLILAMASGLALLAAQAAVARPQGQNSPEKAGKEVPPQSVNVYRVNYEISEIQNGKTVNARSYTLMAKTAEQAHSPAATIRVGSRIPINLGPNNIQYQGVGMDLDCTIAEKEGKLVVHTKFSMSTVSEAEGGNANGPPPVLRTVTLEDDTPAILGRPALVGSIDDVYSNRRYEIGVTVTKLR